MTDLIPLQPLGDVVICVPCKQPVATGHDGRPLILPDLYLKSRANQTSVVVAVGPGALDDGGAFVPIPEAIRVGALVGHRKNVGTDVKYGDVTLTMMRADDIGAVLAD